MKKKITIRCIVVAIAVFVCAMASTKPMLSEAGYSPWGYDENGAAQTFGPTPKVTGFVLKNTEAGVINVHWQSGSITSVLQIQVYRCTQTNSQGSPSVTGGLNATISGENGVTVPYTPINGYGMYGIYASVPVNKYCFLKISSSSTGTAQGRWNPW